MQIVWKFSSTNNRDENIQLKENKIWMKKCQKSPQRSNCFIIIPCFNIGVRLYDI